MRRAATASETGASVGGARHDTEWSILNRGFEKAQQYRASSPTLSACGVVVMGRRTTSRSGDAAAKWMI